MAVVGESDKRRGAARETKLEIAGFIRGTFHVDFIVDRFGEETSLCGSGSQQRYGASSKKDISVVSVAGAASLFQSLE